MSTILLADQNPETRNQLCASLTDDGHFVITAASYHEVIASLDIIKVDLIITRACLPDADWKTLYAQVQAQPGYAKLPIVVLMACRAPLPPRLTAHAADIPTDQRSIERSL